MAQQAGKRAGSRKGAKPARRFRPALLGLAVGITLLVLAWGYLVYAAIDFGASAREGESGAWWFMALAAVGAVACLFAGLMLVVRLLRALGITSPSDRPGPITPTPATTPPPPTQPGGGHRAR